MRFEPAFTPGQFVVGRRRLLHDEDDLERVQQALASASAGVAAQQFHVSLRTLRSFASRHDIRQRPGRPPLLGDATVAALALAECGSFAGAARRLGVARKTLRRFAVAHGLAPPARR